MKKLLTALVVLALAGLLLWAVTRSYPKLANHELHADYAAGERFMKTRHLGTLDLRFISINGQMVSSLSGLAWDADNHILYTLSDKGYLFKLKPEFSSEGRLNSVKPLAVHALLDANERRLVDLGDGDAEDLAILNAADGHSDNTQLMISFEHNSRVGVYSTDGHLIKDLPLPEKLKRRQNYIEPNRALESIMHHPRYGAVVAPEIGMRREVGQRRVLYAIDKEQKGMRWQFYSLPYESSAVVSLESAEDGSVIVLERAWSGMTSPLTVGIRRIKLEQCKQLEPCEVEDLAVFSTDKGWRIDNYEAIAHYKDNQFFIVSDDNGLPMQATLLTLVELDLQ